MIKEYYCPKCRKKLETLEGWGSTSYYCMECNILVSRKKILTKEQIVNEDKK